MGRRRHEETVHTIITVICSVARLVDQNLSGYIAHLPPGLIIISRLRPWTMLVAGQTH